MNFRDGVLNQTDQFQAWLRTAAETVFQVAGWITAIAALRFAGGQISSSALSILAQGLTIVLGCYVAGCLPVRRLVERISVGASKTRTAVEVVAAIILIGVMTLAIGYAAGWLMEEQLFQLIFDKAMS